MGQWMVHRQEKRRVMKCLSKNRPQNYWRKGEKLIGKNVEEKEKRLLVFTGHVQSSGCEYCGPVVDYIDQGCKYSKKNTEEKTDEDDSVYRNGMECFVVHIHRLRSLRSRFAAEECRASLGFGLILSPCCYRGKKERKGQKGRSLGRCG